MLLQMISPYVKPYERLQMDMGIISARHMLAEYPNGLPREIVAKLRKSALVMMFFVVATGYTTMVMP